MSSIDSKDAPLAGNAFKRSAAIVAEMQAGARYEVLHGARHQHLAGTRQARDASADVNSEAAIIVAHDFAFASVQPRSDLDP
jgi:hypothetical protein